MSLNCSTTTVFIIAGLCINSSPCALISTGPTPRIPLGLPPLIAVTTAAGGVAMHSLSGHNSPNSEYFIPNWSSLRMILGCFRVKHRKCLVCRSLSNVLLLRLCRRQRSSAGMVRRQTQVRPTESSPALSAISMESRYGESNVRPKENCGIIMCFIASMDVACLRSPASNTGDGCTCQLLAEL